MEAAVVERAFVEVTGSDAEVFLQGQLSQDLTGGAGVSFLLDPTGKVVALLRFSRIDGGYLLDTDPEAGDAVVARLRRFLLRTKATVEPVDDLELVRVFDGGGAEAVAAAAGVGPVAIAPAWRPGDDVVDLVVARAGRTRPGVDVTGAEVLARLLAAGGESMDAGEHERRRILAGVPRSGVDIGPDTIPAESGRWTIEAGVSFTKGCYTGQELVARIDSRGGNVPRPLRVLRLDAPVAPGAPVTDADGTAVGEVTSAAGDVALAPLARRVEVGDTVTVEGRSGVVEA